MYIICRNKIMYIYIYLNRYHDVYVIILITLNKITINIKHYFRGSRSHDASMFSAFILSNILNILFVSKILSQLLFILRVLIVNLNVLFFKSFISQ